MAAVSATPTLLSPSQHKRSKAKNHLYCPKPTPLRHFLKHLPCSQCPRSISSQPASYTSNTLNEIENRHLRSRYDKFACNNALRFSLNEEASITVQERFDKIPERTHESWSSVISANTRSGDFQQAIYLFGEMMEAGTWPHEFSLASLLKASGGLRDISIGKQLHGWCLRTGFALEPGVRTSLIAMYSNCGFLDDAMRVFGQIQLFLLDDVPTWNSMLAAFVFHGCWSECFELFCNMLSVGTVSPSEYTYASMINACASLSAVDHGKVIHGMIIKDGLLDQATMGNSLITFYSKCGALDEANRMFEMITSKNIVSWNAIVTGHEQNDHSRKAIELFCRLVMLENCVKPNHISFLSVLNAVSSLSELKKGREIHAQTIRLGLEDRTSIANSLITMYSKCKEVEKATLVFERVPQKDIISWNSLFTGLTHNGRFEDCLKVFKRMQMSGIQPDDHSFTIVLGAASSFPDMTKCLRLGKEIHSNVLRQTSIAAGVATYNSILTVYAKCNRLDYSEKIFMGLRKRDSYSWNAMMDGYSINGNHGAATLLFIEMLEQNLQPDHLSFSILLTSCGRAASLETGKQLHAFIIKQQLHHQNFQSALLSINNALVSMYSKCGSISDASGVFIRMQRRDVFSYTAMITACARHGLVQESLRLVEVMRGEGIKPNSVTFLGLLTACAHGGLAKEGIRYFNSMTEDHVNPTVEHYACMVDLFGRLSQFESAINWVKSGISSLKLQKDSCVILWKVLLGACHAHKQLKFGVQAAAKILDLEPGDETTYVLLFNLYATFGMWEDAVRVRGSMQERGLKKQEVGASWIEMGNRRHVFVAGDVCHPNRGEIYEKLEQLNGECRGLGYLPMTEYVLHDVDDLQKEAIIASHSEKLAVSFGLLQRQQGKGIIRVIKNLRVCVDCHNWMKFVSQIEGAEIVLRDARRFHHFRDGICSCGDYW